MLSRDISRETLRSQVRAIGLNIEESELDSLVERVRAALNDIDELGEFNLTQCEPAIAFIRPGQKGGSQ